MATLYLVRHAMAADHGDAWPDDTLRPLTPAGVARMRAAVAGLRALGVDFDVVFTSPLIRAYQTAEVIVAGLKPAPPVIETPALAPGHAPTELAGVLNAEPARSSFALVGHEPGLGELGSWLIGARTPMPFKKGGVCCVECSGRVRAGGGALQWLALPKMLRAMGE
jgi:phosphohistidine phosphatase